MRNILKGFLEPKAENYILPVASEIEMEEDPLPVPEEEPEAVFFDFTVGGEGEAEVQEDGPAKERPREPETPVHYAQLQAELILNQAREEAEALLNQAREQAQNEIEEIRAGARDEGYRDGYAQGIAKAMDDAVRDREETAARMEQDVKAFLEKASLAREELILQSRDELVELCLSIAEKVVRVSLKSSAEVIVRMIQTATERMRRQEWVHIYISGCDTRQVAKISPALTSTVETPEEIVDASVSTQMSNIRDVLHDQLGALWPQ